MGRGSCVRSLALTAGSDGSGVCVGVAGGPEAEERKAQRSYWEEHSRDLTLEGMMLDSRAAELDKEERPEVMLRLLFFFNFRSACLMTLFCLNLESMSVCHVCVFASQISRWQSLRGTRGESETTGL